MNVPEKLKFVLGRVENIVEKGKNAGYQHFLLFLQCFQKHSVSGSLLCCKELKPFYKSLKDRIDLQIVHQRVIQSTNKCTLTMEQYF